LLPDEVADADPLGPREIALRFANLVIAAQLSQGLSLPLFDASERIFQPGELLVGQILLGLAPGLGQLLLSIVEILLRGVGLLDGSLGVALLAFCARLTHLGAAAGRAAAGLLGLQPLQLPSHAFGLLLQLTLLSRKSLQLAAPLGFVRELFRSFPFFAQPLLLVAQAGKLLLRLAELFDQPSQFTLAAVRENIEHFLQLFGDLALLLLRLAELVFAELAARFAHLSADGLLASFGQGVGNGARRQGIAPFEFGGHPLHAFFDFVELPRDIELPGRQFLEIGLLLRREFLQILGQRLSA
jgi:hypothetical protein